LTVPDTLTGSGVRDIPQESRRVETWGGYVCGDVHTVIAVNVTPLARSLAASLAACTALFRAPVAAAPMAVPGARCAARLDGLTHGDSPAEPQWLTMVLAETGSGRVTVSIRTWERDDIRDVVERIVRSLEIRDSALSL
jgi:hypothetical protein